MCEISVGEENMKIELDQIISQIEPLCEDSMRESKARWDNIAKPLSSLGKLETTVIRIAGIQRSVDVVIDKPAVAIMCADNGVVVQGVTQVDSSVTAVVSENLTKASATVCIMSKCVGADVVPVDIGINKDMDVKGLINKKVMYGTNDMTLGSAMSKEQCIKAIEVGIETVVMLKEKGYNIIATGEMGIGNTTTSSAIASVLLSQEVELVTGKGAGLCSEGLTRKINAIKKAIEVNRPKPQDPIDVLYKLGGLDIAGLVGIYLGGAITKTPVLIDGFISGISALLACEIAPLCKNYMIASHVSAEPAGKMVLDALGMTPMITCDMCLGEGTGAVAGLSVIAMGLAVYNEMKDFSQAKIEHYKELN